MRKFFGRYSRVMFYATAVTAFLLASGAGRKWW